MQLRTPLTSGAPSHRLGIAFLAFAAICVTSANAQTFQILHNFTGGLDGGNPYSGLSIDAGGHLYGTAIGGGEGNCPPYANGCGLVFQLKHAGSGWTFSPIYHFAGDGDGAQPYGRVIPGPNGSLYGTTISGGSAECSSGCGTVFNLQPPVNVCKTTLCSWRETVLYRFAGGTDAFYPTGDLTFDHAGALYGTTTEGGSADKGAVYKLTPSGSNWTESVLYSFTGGADGSSPYSGVVIDNAGKLYGTTVTGGSNDAGAVFQLTSSGSGWSETTLHDFQGANDGTAPYAGLIFDQSGNLYGATNAGGASGAGTVYELSPSGGGWTFATVFAFPGGSGTFGPWGKLVMDGAGNFYGTTQGNPDNGDYGTVFKLTHSSNGWTQTILHEFNGSDGNDPFSNLVFDASGNLYGTTNVGGAYGYGVVFEITP